MPRVINYQGKRFTFSDQLSDQQVSDILKKSSQSPLQKFAGSEAAKFGAPLLGGMGGAAVGGAMGAAGGPVGTAVGAMRGGELGGAGMEALREKVAGEPLSAQKIAGEGVMNALAEPVGIGLKLGAKGLGAAGARLFGGATGSEVARAGAKYAPEMVSQIEKSVAGPIGERQISKRLAASIANKNQLLKAADATGATTYAHDLLAPVTKMIGDMRHVGSSDAAKIEKLATDFMERIKSAKLNPSRVDAIKKAAEDKAAKIFAESGARRASGQVTRRLTSRSAIENFNIALAEGARNWLEQLPEHGTQIAETNSTTKSLIHAGEAMGKRSFSKGFSRVAGAAAGAPLGLPYHVGALGGYMLGPTLEPLTTSIAGLGAQALQNPTLAAILQQIPRIAGQGAIYTGQHDEP